MNKESKKFRAFKKTLGWCDCIYIFDLDISFKSIKENESCKILFKEDYIGEFIFDLDYLKNFEKDEIDGKECYFQYLFLK